MRINNSNFKMRSDLHLARKSWHVLAVLFMAFIYSHVDRGMALKILAVAMFLFVGMDILRLKIEKINVLVLKVFGVVMRRTEIDHPAGTTYLLSGVFISVYLFPKDIVMLTLFFLAIADPVASYFGIRYGKDKIINNKSLQGTMAAFVVCAIIAFIYMQVNKMLLERIVLVSLISGIIGALSELIPFFKLDDNLTFPIVCSFSLWALINSLS